MDTYQNPISSMIVGDHVPYEWYDLDAKEDEVRVPSPLIQAISTGPPSKKKTIGEGMVFTSLLLRAQSISNIFLTLTGRNTD